MPYRLAARFFSRAVSDRAEDQPSQTAIAQPPYTPVFDLAAGWRGIAGFFAGLSLDNYAFLGSDPLYFLSYVKSLEIAAFSTLMLLLIGYPIAYAIVRAPLRLQARTACCSSSCRSGPAFSSASMPG